MTEIVENNKLSHPSFPQPPDTSVKIWRYMDLAKLIWTLSNRKLYLSRVDLLNDPHEGSTPRLLAKLRDDLLRQHGAGQSLIDQLPQIYRNNRTSCYVNCWHLGDSESEAMWRLYCPNGYGVAIQTTYQCLVESIVHEPFLYIGRITYIDYETQGFHLNNMFNSIMHKRISFAHEDEVRLVKSLSEYWGLPTRVGPSGITVAWDAEPVVERLFVDPYAAEWYLDVVLSVVKIFAPAIESKTVWSQMKGEPVF
jgi:hypothetical protein